MQKGLQNKITTQDMVKITGKTRMTISRWRKEQGLNKHVIKAGHAVLFDLPGVERWAKQHNIHLNLGKIKKAAKQKTKTNR